MSGHSKWNNIKNRKGAADAARGATFTKIGRELAVAVKVGGPDPKTNSKLRDIMAKAHASNIPNDNIMRSIKKASGELGSINYETIVYEGYGPSGTAVIVETLTDNKNRTAGDVRHLFDKMGGNMGTSGCVSYMFESRGYVVVEKTSGEGDDEMMMLALECGADDFNAEDDCYVMTTSPSDLGTMRDALEAQGRVIISAEVDRVPANRISLEGDAAESFQKMINLLEELDDVQEVFHNADISSEGDEVD